VTPTGGHPRAVPLKWDRQLLTTTERVGPLRRSARLCPSSIRARAPPCSARLRSMSPRPQPDEASCSQRPASSSFHGDESSCAPARGLPATTAASDLPWPETAPGLRLVARHYAENADTIAARHEISPRRTRACRLSCHCLDAADRSRRSSRLCLYYAQYTYTIPASCNPCGSFLKSLGQSLQI